MSAPRPAWLEIDLGAIRHNVSETRRWTGDQTRIIAVVKANAYGHGLVPAARAALDGGAFALGVAIAEEALTLRAAGILAPVLVMGASEPAAAEELVRHSVDAVVSTLEQVHALGRAAVRQQRAARVHVKIDTGMGRVGVSRADAAEFMARVAAEEGVTWAGLMTHFATADENDSPLAARQWSEFQKAISSAIPLYRFTAGGGAAEPLTIHAANSAAICRVRAAWETRVPGALFAVRPGLLTYGITPVDGGPLPGIRPALALKARVAQARDVPAGTTVSYGATFATRRPSRLAIVPLGYADGYSRANSSRACVLLRGRRAPVVGRVCMDQFVVDATEMGAEAGDEVTLLGLQGDDEISVHELAAWSDTIHHETLVRLGERLPRVYLHTDTP